MTTNGSNRPKPSAFGRLNERAKALNDAKVNVLTVVVFFAGLAVLTAMATGIGYIVHGAAKSFERPVRR